MAKQAEQSPVATVATADLSYTSFSRYFIDHPVLANLCMVVVLIAGILSAYRLNTQLLPDFKIEQIFIRIVWPGSSAREVLHSVVNPVESVLRGVNHVRSIRSTATDNSGFIQLEFKTDTDMRTALDKVRARVDGATLPEKAEKPDIYEPVLREEVMRLVLYGAPNLAQLRYYGNQAEKQLQQLGVDRVDLQGLAEQDLTVLVSPYHLHALNRDLYGLSQQIGRGNLELPLGTMGQDSLEVGLRGRDQRTQVDEFLSMHISANLRDVMYLREFAQIAQTANAKAPRLFVHNQPALSLSVGRLQNQGNTFVLVDRVHSWLQQVRNSWPQSLQIEPYAQTWKLLQMRIALLQYNGLLGFIFIFALLLLFLHWRMAFWVAAGIPIAIATTLVILDFSGGDINMLSTFSLVMALGIIVDDTVVVAEQAYTLFQAGLAPRAAVLQAIHTMFLPIFASSLTTVAAFLPLLLMGGLFGKILNIIPYVIICVIIASLWECFCILPYHLTHAFKHIQLQRWRQDVNRYFEYFQYHLFRSALTKSIQNAYVTLLLGFFVVAVAIMMLAFGWVKFDFFPSPPNDVMFLDASFYPGTPVKVVREFLANADSALSRIDKMHADEKDPLVILPVQMLFYPSPIDSGYIYAQSPESLHASMFVQLSQPDTRKITNPALQRLWAGAIESNPQVSSLRISEPKAGPPGTDFSLLIQGDDPQQIKQSSLAMQAALRRFQGVRNVFDNMPYGRQEYVFSIRPHALTLPLDRAALLMQLRAAFYGEEVQTFVADDETIKVMVRTADKYRDKVSLLRAFPVQVGTKMLPLGDLVQIDTRQDFAYYRHYNGRLSADVKADVDVERANLHEILAYLRTNVVPDIENKYAVKVGFDEQSKYEMESLTEMRYGAIYGVLIIYLVLAWVLRSYRWPVLVLLMLPLALAGAVLGHYLLKINFTLLSMFGVFGLSGIVVNNAIILLHRFQMLQAQSELSLFQSVIQASCDRVRPVLFTTLTTIAGLMPLMLETSLQAQFLIPMAVSISFGLLIGTTLIMLILPVSMVLCVADTKI